MIKRVTSLKEFEMGLYCIEAEVSGLDNVPLHYGCEKFDRDMLWKAWGNVSLLLNECVIVANFDKPDHIDAFIWFVIGNDYRVNKIIAQSYIWLSLSPLMGIKVYKEAERILMAKGNIDYITMGVLQNSPTSSKTENVLCNRLGYKPEGRSFYKEL